MNYLRCVVFLLISVATVGLSRAADIYTLIQSGKTDQARTILENLGRDSARTGNAQYFRALLESDGRKSAGLLEEALNNNPDRKYRDDITLRLAQYYTVKGDYNRVAATLDAAKISALAGVRLQTLAAEKLGADQKARSKFETGLGQSATPEQKQWLGIDLARISLAAGKRKAALTTLQSLVNSKNKQTVPQALYLLCRSAVEAGEIDEAARWYNLLNDQFPSAVGLDDLVEKLGSVPTQPESDTRAEKATGTFYSVKVGVFSSSDNAAQQAARFSSLKVKVETVRKTVGGKPYSIVFVGRYPTFDDADRVRQELESKFSEQYQVVAR